MITIPTHDVVHTARPCLTSVRGMRRGSREKAVHSVIGRVRSSLHAEAGRDHVFDLRINLASYLLVQRLNLDVLQLHEQREVWIEPSARQPQGLAKHRMPNIHSQLARRTSYYIPAPHNLASRKESVVGLGLAEVLESMLVEVVGPQVNAATAHQKLHATISVQVARSKDWHD